MALFRCIFKCQPVAESGILAESIPSEQFFHIHQISVITHI